MQRVKGKKHSVGEFNGQQLKQRIVMEWRMSCNGYRCCACWVAKSCLTLWSHGLQHARLSCPTLSPGVCSNSRSLIWWCHPTISFSVTSFSSCPQSSPASGSFPMSQISFIFWKKKKRTNLSGHIGDLRMMWRGRGCGDQRETCCVRPAKKWWPLC